MTTFLMVFIKAYWKQIAGGAVVVAVMVCIVVAWNIHGDSRYNAGQAAANQEWKKKWADRDTADALATAQREKAERDEEQRRQQAADEERKRADEELAKMQADADAAQRAGDGLRKQLATLQRQLAGSETGRVSAIAAAGAAKAQAGVLLAQLLGEADTMAGEFAKEADERYVAGSTCERTYDKIMASQ
jgi:chromosome segregation ATPase